MLVGSRLKEARKKLDYTQEKLAELIGVTKGAVSLYENERRNPNLETLIEISFALGVSANYLLGQDVMVEVESEEIPSFSSLTKDEYLFITELRKDKIHYETLFNDYKRGLELIKRL